MEKQEDNYSAPNFATLDYSMDGHEYHRHESTNYLLNNLPQQQQLQLSFADVMHFADFGPKLALNQTRISEQDEELQNNNDNGNDDDDPVYFLKFPVLNDKSVGQDQSLVVPQANDSVAVDDDNDEERFFRSSMMMSSAAKAKEVMGDQELDELEEEDERDDMSSVHHLQFLGEDLQKRNDMYSSSVVGNPSSSEPNNNNNNKNKRKRPRTLKSSEEVESQRMTHIAVERNRRKQMNEHLRVLRSLMPGSYVQRGDQASIIGGAIEFVRELEQLLQCLESQKRRRLLGDQPGPARQPVGPNSDPTAAPPPQPFFPLPSADDDLSPALPFDHQIGGPSGMIVREETAESKSCVADVEVRLLGFDAMIKILSRRRPGQLIKAVAALEDLNFNILHTNITTIEQTVLYSFNVKVTSESRFSAEDIASSVQQIFSFIHASTTM